METTPLPRPLHSLPHFKTALGELSREELTRQEEENIEPASRYEPGRKIGAKNNGVKGGINVP